MTSCKRPRNVGVTCFLPGILQPQCEQIIAHIFVVVGILIEEVANIIVRYHEGIYLRLCQGD